MEIYKLINGLDYGVMIAYVLIVAGIGAWVSLRNRQKNEHLFLAQHSLGWPSIGLTMWGTNVGPSMLIASCSIAYTTGIVAANFSWLAFIFIYILAMVFAPLYRFSKSDTLPGFIGTRFNPLSRELLAWYTVVTILISWLGLTLYAGGILTSQITDWPLWVSLIALAAFSAFFTLAGGLKTVAHTNVFQMSLLIVASGILVIAGLIKVGGFGAIAAATPPDYWKLFLPADNPDFPWYAILLGYPVLGIWFWCTDQSMVQSVLAAKSLPQGKLGTNFTGWLKVIDMPLFILPGILCFVLFPNLDNPDEAYMTMVKELLPHGLIGLIMAVLVAALVSTIASALNSLSTVFTLDIYLRRFRPEATTKETVRIGRTVTVAGAAVSVFIALAIANIEGLDLFSLFQAVLGFLAPPLTAVFLLGALWKRATSRAANITLTAGTGFSLGIGVLYFNQWPSAEFWPHFMLLSFLICSGLILAMVALSLLTFRKKDASGFVSVRQATADEPKDRRVTILWTVLILVMVGLYIFFNEPVQGKGKEAPPPKAPAPAVSELPDWFNKNRVQLHWEGPLLHLSEDGTPDKRFVQWLKPVHNWIETMGPSVTIGLAKKDSEGAWWPTQVGESIPEARERNIYKEFFLDSMQSRGIEYIAYYRHDIEKQVADDHPEWRALDAEGNPIPSNRDKNTFRLCYNSPFAGFVQARLVELVELGTQGVYFDEDHMPEVCTCEFCRKQFAASRGYPMPENLKPYTEEYLDVAKFVGETIYRTFANWKAAVSEVNPDVVFIAGNRPFVQFDGIHHPETLADSVDALKIEFQKCFGGLQHWPGAPIQQMLKAHPDYYSPTRSQQESLAWMIARDAAGGRPASLWNWKPDADFGETFHSNMAIVAHGNISSTHVDFFAKEQFYEELFDLSDRLGAEFADAQPYGWLAIHVSNSLKEAAYPAQGSAANSYRQRFEQLYAPVLAATDVVQKAHLPMITIMDTQLRAGKVDPQTKVIVVPSADLLPADLQAALERIEATGVGVIRLSSEDAWHLAASAPQLQEALLATIREKVGQPPIQLEAPAEVRANYFLNHNGTGMLVTAVRDWNDFWFFGDDRSNRRADQPEKPDIPSTSLILRTPEWQSKTATEIDYDGDTDLSSAQISEGELSLPSYPIYQFIQLTSPETEAHE